MFTVSSSLIWAVLTGPTDWVCHIGTLMLYVTWWSWFWWDSSLIFRTSWFPSVLWRCWIGHVACINHPQNDLWCVEWDVKPLHYACFAMHCKTELPSNVMHMTYVSCCGWLTQLVYLCKCHILDPEITISLGLILVDLHRGLCPFEFFLFSCYFSIFFIILYLHSKEPSCKRLVENHFSRK